MASLLCRNGISSVFSEMHIWMEVLFVSSITFESTANIGILGAAREVQQVGQGWLLGKTDWVVTSSLERG